MGIIQKIFGTRSEREVKKLMPLVTRIESMEDEMKALTDEQLREKTDEFRKRYQGGEDLDNLLPEAFAVCREAADRVLGMRPPSAARRRTACSACGRTVCSSSAASCCIRAASRR